MNIKYLIPLMFLILLAVPSYAYTIRTTFYDESTLSAIPTVTITDANTTVYTSDVNGLWVADLTGAKSFEISKAGYDTRPFEFYFKADANYNFLLSPTGTDSEIEFTVLDTSNNAWANKYLIFQGMPGLFNFWDINTATFTRSLSVAAEDTGPTGVTFKPDGTEMYIIGTTSDSVHQYTLSTAWDISTATFTRSLSVAAKETFPSGVIFKSDGTEMYIIGWNSDSVHQYALSTAWNISTATFTRSLSVSAKDTEPGDVTFKSDGTEMYIIGNTSDSVHQYALSTAWNISTATFTRSLSVTAKDTTPTDVIFKSDGTEMYIIGTSSDSVHQYALSTAWDISTATFTRSLSVSAKDTAPNGVTFKSDGTEMYIIGTSSDSVHQYTLGTRTPAIINSLKTTSSGTATASLLPAGDYNALLYNATGDFNYTYAKTVVTVNKPLNEKTSSAISPFDISVSGLLQYALTNQTASSVSFNVFAGTEGFYTFTAVDYNAVISDQKYIPKSYFVQVPMGNDYESAVTYTPYLLLKTDAIVPKGVVLDQLNRTIENAQIYVSKYVGGVLKIVESGNTFSNGAFNFSAYPLDVYYLTVYYAGINKGTFSVQPRDTTDVFYIKIDRTTAEEITQKLIIQTDLSAISRYQNRDTNINVLGTITSNLNYITDYNVNVYERGNLIYSSKVTTSGLSIAINKTVDVNLIPESVHNAVIKVIVNYSVDGVTGTQTFSKNIMISNSSDVMATIDNAVTEIGQPLAMFIALLVSIILIAILVFSGIITDPAILGVFGALVLGVFMFIGFLDIGVVVLGMDIGKFAYFLGLMATLYFAFFGGR